MHAINQGKEANKKTLQ